jgi:Flp pilus assembly protein TadG
MVRAWLPFRRLRRLGLDDLGSASIETAVSLTVAISLAFWLFELSSYAYTYAVLDDAVHEGVRYAISHGSDSSNCSGPTSGCTDASGANVTTVVTDIAKESLHNMSGLTVSVNWPDASGCKPGALVKVSVTYPYVAFFSSLGFGQTAQASAEGRIVF